MNTEQARFNMIEQQIRPWDVLDAKVLALLARVRREEFVPAECRNLAFTDTEIPLLEGQCMLAPRVEARLLQEAKVQPNDRVLEIGTGSGFMAALLAQQAQTVITLELRPALAKLAADNLRRSGVANVTVRAGDGARGLSSEAPFDVIVLSGSVATVPKALREQLKIGGRLIAIVGEEPVMRARLITRTAAQQWATQDLFDTVAARLDGFEEASTFVF
jgi:protein-L-isoaspartate(D-aspartate) O-methyltransferase